MTATVKVPFPEELLVEVDRIADQKHLTRSELLIEAVRLYIEMHPDHRCPGEDPRVQSAVAVQDALARLAPSSNEDSTADVRCWREGRC